MWGARRGRGNDGAGSEGGCYGGGRWIRWVWRIFVFFFFVKKEKNKYVIIYI